MYNDKIRVIDISVTSDTYHFFVKYSGFHNFWYNQMLQPLFVPTLHHPFLQGTLDIFSRKWN